MAITWIAHYPDGGELNQSSGFTYRDINRDQLTAFSILKDDNPILVIDFRDDTNGDPDIGQKRLIWRKRHSLSTNGGNTAVYLAGWQRQVKGRNIQSICYVTESGTIALGGQWLEDTPLMHGIKPLEWETDLV